MKRVKILVTAMTVLAVVGGALAFKANNAYSGNLRCTFIDPGAEGTYVCPQVTYTETTVGSTAWCTLKTLPEDPQNPCIKKTVEQDN